jgi:hypothetical protein
MLNETCSDEAAVLTRFASIMDRNDGAATAANTPMMAMTSITSMMVKPLERNFIKCRIACERGNKPKRPTCGS